MGSYESHLYVIVYLTRLIVMEPECLYCIFVYDYTKNGLIQCSRQNLVFLVFIFVLFRHKSSEFRINCFKFTQYFTVNFCYSFSRVVCN